MDSLVTFVLLSVLWLLLTALLITCLIIVEYSVKGKSAIENAFCVTGTVIKEKIKQDGVRGLTKAIWQELRNMRKMQP